MMFSADFPSKKIIKTGSMPIKRIKPKSKPKNLGLELRQIRAENNYLRLEIRVCRYKTVLSIKNSLI